MERNMICIDFLGLPGSGKSTLSHLLSERFHKDLDVVEPSYHLDHECGCLQRCSFKILGVLIYAFYHPFWFWHLMQIIYKQHSPLKKTFFVNLLNVAYKLNELASKKLCVVIFDQGLWQSVLSLYYQDSEISTEEFADTYSKIQRLAPAVRTISVYVKTDIETSIDRMRRRHSNVSRVESLDEKSMKEELRSQKRLIEAVEYDIEVDSSKNDIATCVDYLYNKTKGIVNN